MLGLSYLFYSVDELKIQFTAILDTIPQSVVFADNSGKQGWVNPHAAELLQLPTGNIAPVLISATM